MTVLDEYWQKFLKETGRDSEEKCSGDLNFNAKGFVNAELNALALSGQKTAFFTSLAEFNIDMEPLPISGELYILVDNNENPLCVLEITNVKTIPFNEVTWEMAKKEGEDENLESWREKQREYLEEEGTIQGFEFSMDIKIVMQEFRVIYK